MNKSPGRSPLLVVRDEEGAGGGGDSDKGVSLRRRADLNNFGVFALGIFTLLYLIAGVAAFCFLGIDEALKVGVVGMLIEAVWGLAIYLPRRRGPSQ